MAVNIFNSLTFGTVNSADYGIYISGPGVYDAPTRDIEFVNVPGRNGALEIDKGHWNNIEVKYTAGTFGDNQDMFAQKISAFRNAIASQIGYQRLTDSYNPEEYRLGIYASGLSVNPVARNAAGEFELVFNCKPQRFLLSGESPLPVSSGQTLRNPTLYSSHPLIKIGQGYGTLEFNGYQIELEDARVGKIQIGDKSTSYNEDYSSIVTFETEIILKEGLCLRNDRLIVEPGYVWGNLYFDDPNMIILGILAGTETGTGHSSLYRTGRAFRYDYYVNAPTSAKYGTNFTSTYSATYRIEYTTEGSSVVGAADVTIRLTMNYIASTNTLKLRVNIDTGYVYLTTSNVFLTVGEVSADSSIMLTGDVYVDTETGNAFKFNEGQEIDLNRFISLGSDLPSLAPGDNVITYDNTMRDVQMATRWWEL